MHILNYIRQKAIRNICTAQRFHMQITSSLFITEILNHLILLANQYHFTKNFKAITSWGMRSIRNGGHKEGMRNTNYILLGSPNRLPERS